MAKVLVKDTTLTGIADSIRAKAGVASKLRPSEMAAAIENIPTGGGGIELPELANPAGAENIQKGFEAVNGFGVKITGTHEEPPALPTLSDAATADDIAKGKEVIDGNGNKITGSLYTVTGDLLTDFGRVKKVGSELEVRSAAIASDKILRSTATVSNRVPLANLGDATAADVAAGKTFTSAAGLTVTGEAEGASGLFDTFTYVTSYINKLETVSVPNGFRNPGTGKTVMAYGGINYYLGGTNFNGVFGDKGYGYTNVGSPSDGKGVVAVDTDEDFVTVQTADTPKYKLTQMALIFVKEA